MGDFWMGVLVGLVIGSVLSLFCLSLCVAASRGWRDKEGGSGDWDAVTCACGFLEIDCRCGVDD